MSRFSDYDDYDEQFPNQREFWHANAARALKGKRGRKALAELREALMALPAHRLIEGAVCTVDAPSRQRAVREGYREEFLEEVQQQGEGVCAIGAYLWYREVKAGADPARAFDTLPTIYDPEDDALDATASLAATKDGLTFALAWQLAYRNDETFKFKTPEERHAAFIAWIDGELASAAA